MTIQRTFNCQMNYEKEQSLRINKNCLQYILQKYKIHILPLSMMLAEFFHKLYFQMKVFYFILIYEAISLMDINFSKALFV